MNSLFPAQSKFLAAAFFAVLALCGSLAQAWTWTPNSQEEAIATLMKTNPEQRRPELVFDPILAEVARARAADMAARGYFDHVNPDGVAANFLISHAGYSIPHYWEVATDSVPNPDAQNYVESIGAGYTTPQDVWNAWMNSPHHKTHLLGLDDTNFFMTETRYGIGYVNVQGSQNGTYWVVITAPPSEVYIKDPQTGIKLTDLGGITVSGTAPTDQGIASIAVSVVTKSGTSDPVILSGTSDWSANLQNLSGGLNTLLVQGLDGSNGIVSKASVDLNYVPPVPLVVTVSGSGSVTSALTGTTSQVLGTSLNIVATPAKGYLFAGWTGGITSSSPKLKFTVQPDLVLQANFVADPFPGAKGSYTGLTTSGTDGFLNVSLNPTGAFSGKISLGTASYGFSGRFSPLGAADLLVKRSGTTALQVHLDLATDGSQEITGTITDGTVVSNFSTDLSVFGKSNPTLLAGSYTVLFAPATTGTTNPPSPAGNGVATLKITPAGVAIISGQLADDTRFTFTSSVSKNGLVPVYVAISGKQGLLAGDLSFSAQPNSDATGQFRWVRLPSVKSIAYPIGFDVVLNASASLYLPPPKIGTLSVPPPSELLLVDSTGTPLVDCPVMVTSSGKIQLPIPAPNRLQLSTNPSTGLITGSFLNPNTNLKSSIHGVYFQKLGTVAFGYFSGGPANGGFAIQPPPP